MVYYNAFITGEYNALYTPTNQGFFSLLNLVQIRVERECLFFSVRTSSLFETGLQQNADNVSEQYGVTSYIYIYHHPLSLME